MWEEEIGVEATVQWLQRSPKALTIPQAPPSFVPEDDLGARRGDAPACPLSWWYSIEVCLEMPGRCGSAIRWEAAILVVSAPLSALRLTIPGIFRDRPRPQYVRGDQRDVAMAGWPYQDPPFGHTVTTFPTSITGVALADRTQDLLVVPGDRHEDLNNFGGIIHFAPVYPHQPTPAPLATLPSLPRPGDEEAAEDEEAQRAGK